MRIAGIGSVSGLAFHGLAILLTLLLAEAVLPIAEPWKVIAAVTVIRMSILVPFSVSGLGVQEALAAVSFPAAGLPAEIGVSISLLSRLALLGSMGTGAVFMFKDDFRKLIPERHSHDLSGQV